jgi:eukaryotic-like serine/threonine-protein kinase
MSKAPTFHCAPRARGSMPPPPRVVGDQYELIELIGEGGMGVVWRARDRRLQIDVAVKLVHPDPSPLVMRRLMAEARAAAKVRHPSAVQVHGTGQTPEGEPYIVMELLDGESLEDRLDREGVIGEAEAAKLMIPVLAAVAAAHDAGLIHRDLKPSNIFLSRVGSGRIHPKLLDFGIAKHLDSIAVDVTMPGAVLGTPSYMAPEQARGLADIDLRADVWSLAAVMYELLTGRPPFDGDNYNAVLSQVLVDEPPPLDTVEPTLAGIVMRGLHKDRNERWSDARSLGEALARWLLRRGHEHDVTSASLRQSSLFPRGGPGPSLRAMATTGDGISLSPREVAPTMPALGGIGNPTAALARSGRSATLAVAGVMAALIVAAAFVRSSRTATTLETHAAIYALAATAPALIVGAPQDEPSPTTSAVPTPVASASPSATTSQRRRRRPTKPVTQATAKPKTPAHTPKKSGPGRHHMPLPPKLSL